MRILALADIHGNTGMIRRIGELKREFDVIAVAGDITNFGPAEDAENTIRILREVGKPVLAVPGNCDPIEVTLAIERGGGVNLHERTYEIEDVTFIGFGGSNRTPFNTPTEFSEEEIYDAVSSLLERVRKVENLVLLSHVPPKNTLDFVPPDKHIGSSALEKLKNEFDVIICGHVHEARGILNEEVLIVNPGRASRGYVALIDMKKKIAELFEL